MSWFDPPHRLYTQTQRAARAAGNPNVTLRHSTEDARDSAVRLEALLDSPQRRDLAVVLTWFIDNQHVIHTVFNDLAELFTWPRAARYATHYDLLFLCNKGLFLGCEQLSDRRTDAEPVGWLWAYRLATVADYLHIIQRFKITSEEVIQLDRAFTMDYRDAAHTPANLPA